MKLLLTFNTQSTLAFTKQIAAFIASNKYVSQWSLVYPGCYFTKTNFPFRTTFESFKRFFSGHFFLLAVVGDDNEQIDGGIRKEIWDWFVASEDVDWTKLLADLTKNDS